MRIDKLSRLKTSILDYILRNRLKSTPNTVPPRYTNQATLHNTVLIPNAQFCKPSQLQNTQPHSLLFTAQLKPATKQPTMPFLPPSSRREVLYRKVLFMSALTYWALGSIRETFTSYINTCGPYGMNIEGLVLAPLSPNPYFRMELAR